MSDKIEPALTAEEWAQLEADALDLYDTFVRGERPHMVAAAMLYEEPFGFTREDVVFLRATAEIWYDKDASPALEWLAARIEALLPPETMT